MKLANASWFKWDALPKFLYDLERSLNFEQYEKRQTVVLQQTNKCSMSTIEALKKGMKYVQS